MATDLQVLPVYRSWLVYYHKQFACNCQTDPIQPQINYLTDFYYLLSYCRDFLRFGACFEDTNYCKWPQSWLPSSKPPFERQWDCKFVAHGCSHLGHAGDSDYCFSYCDCSISYISTPGGKRCSSGKVTNMSTNCAVICLMMQQRSV